MVTKTYKDIDLDFRVNPATGDLLLASGADAIKKAFRNLIQTNLYEVPHNPTMGTNIRGSLFENFAPLNIEFLKAKIKELADEREPRVQIQGIDVNQREDYGSLQVTVRYKIIELNRIDSITLFVGRTK